MVALVLWTGLNETYSNAHLQMAIRRPEMIRWKVATEHRRINKFTRRNFGDY